MSIAKTCSFTRLVSAGGRAITATILPMWTVSVALLPFETSHNHAFAGVVTPQPKAGAPLPDLTVAELNRFNIGRVLYNTPLSVADGLGPIFNKSNCGNCHNNPVGGPGSQMVTRFGRDEKGTFDPLDDLGGSLLQVSFISLDCEEIIPVEANVTQNRVTNGALAYGLVEAIPDTVLLANRDAQPLAQRGVAHMVEAFEDPPASPLRVGRFGWKAQVATVLTFSADASLNEMGLTNRFIQTENAPNGNLAQLALCDTVADPEDGPDGQGFDFIDRVTDFQRFLAPFPQTPKTGMTGETLFNTIGCAVCHTPSYTTSNDAGLEDAIRNKVIRPYSDFLLHDMGLSGDPIVQGAGTQQLVKTPPLWGLRTRDPMWHDGRFGGGKFADRVTLVIAEHDVFGSQAQPSAQAFDALSASDKSMVLAFLGSLGQAEFDSDVNNVIDFLDYVALRGCYSGPGLYYTPDDPCSIHDIDQDGDVDLDDATSFMLVYEGHRRDCNGNGVIDLLDILSGFSADVDQNGIPDSCEPTCLADINGTGNVGVPDLLAVINQWGPCPPLTLPCGADVDNNHIVGVPDLLAIINAWGNCP